MKKVISIILSISLLIGTMSIGGTAYAEVLEERAIDNFVESTCDVIREYDSDKEFVVEEETEESQSEADEALDDIDFQTCRLIVKANGAFDDYGAKEHIKGFRDIHILQYESEILTKTAFNSLQNEKNIASVKIDKAVSPLQAGETEDTSTDVFPESSNGHLCDWATERTQSAQVNKYIEENNIALNDITVGVIDSGVDYNHEFLQGRIKRTNFNSSTDGKPNDEFDSIEGHGTATSSVVVDNTPKSVSVAVYRVLDNEGDNSILGVTTGMIKAVDDGVDIISMSMGYGDENDLTKSAVDYANDNGIPVVCSSGNESADVIYWMVSPAINNTISVSASSKKNRYCYWSNSGSTVDLSAPGEEINVAVPNNRYDVWGGTSFSCPSVASAIATVKSVFYEYSYDDIISKLIDSAIPLKAYADPFSHFNQETMTQENVYNLKIAENCSNYGKGLIQLGDIFNFSRPESPKINKKSGNYADSVTVTIESDYPVYYTTDGTYPDSSSSLYSKPLTFSEDTDLRAVTYDENADVNYSLESEAEYQLFTTGTDDMFEIDENGFINSYNGDVQNLLVTDVINGIEVTGFSAGIFNNLSKIILPNSITEIPSKAFNESKTLSYINTGGAKTVKNLGISFNDFLFAVDMPEVEALETNAIRSNNAQYGLYFTINAPKLETIYNAGIYNPSTFIINAPNLKNVENKSFYRCNMMYADFPNLKNVTKTLSIVYQVFYDCSVMYINLPSLEESEIPILYDCEGLQYINAPNFQGKLANNHPDDNYYFVTYYNISKSNAIDMGLPYYDIEAMGGSIRVTDAGLRFGFSYDESQTEKVDEYGFVYTNNSNYENALRVNNVDSKNIYQLKANNRITHEDNKTTFNLVFTKIPSSAYDMEISARAYVKIDDTYFYSDVLQRSYNQVANLVLADDAVDESIKQSVRKILNKEV